MSKVEFNVILRNPVYPVIIISVDRLYSAFNINQLAENCLKSIPAEKSEIIKAIDSTGKEFWYSASRHTISPGFSFKKTTKKQIIEMYNKSQGVNKSDLEYSVKSLSNKRLDRIIIEICERLKAI
ncbi:hypothetical protein H0A36_17250 [Endozoicomonas sp. SM1973]|uniref:Uncharacterized protein n=2 Tax=Spartinivicinus marinus TaxID=2994442 RepID=A0A853I2Z8_9GAMM|nr:hypothetical protein [Spartinivicinus marinus]